MPITGHRDVGDGFPCLIGKDSAGDEYTIEAWTDGDLTLGLASEPRLTFYFTRDDSEALARIFDEHARTGRISPPKEGDSGGRRSPVACGLSGSPTPAAEPAVGDDIRDKLDEFEDAMTAMAENVGKIGERLGMLENRVNAEIDILTERMGLVIDKARGRLEARQKAFRHIRRRLDAIEARLYLDNKDEIAEQSDAFRTLCGGE